MKASNVQILLLRLVMGVLFLQLGYTKIAGGWIQHPEPLEQSVRSLNEHASGIQLWYLQTVADPYVGIWSTLIAAGEMAYGISLFLGLLVRLSAALAIFMLINLHAATGDLFSINFFGSPSGAILVALSLVLFLSRAGRWIGIDAYLAQSDAKGVLW